MSRNLETKPKSLNVHIKQVLLQIMMMSGFPANNIITRDHYPFWKETAQQYPSKPYSEH